MTTSLRPRMIKRKNNDWQTRRWCFTTNNLLNEDVTGMQEFQQYMLIEFLILGEERAPTKLDQFTQRHP
jgi:hypothetical protein